MEYCKANVVDSLLFLMHSHFSIAKHCLAKTSSIALRFYLERELPANKLEFIERTSSRRSFSSDTMTVPKSNLVLDGAKGARCDQREEVGLFRRT